MTSSFYADEHAGLSPGNQLLPETEPTEWITRLEIDSKGEEQYFLLGARITNTNAHAYAVTVTGVHLDDGSVLSNQVTSEPIKSGELRTMRGRWLLPNNAIPVAIDIIGSRVTRSTEKILEARRAEIRDFE